MKHFVSSFGSPEGQLFCLMGSEGKLFNTTNISGQANYHRDSQKNRKKKCSLLKSISIPVVNHGLMLTSSILQKLQIEDRS